WMPAFAGMTAFAGHPRMHESPQNGARIRRASERNPVARAEVPAIAMLFPAGVHIAGVGLFGYPLARNRHIVMTVPTPVTVGPHIAAPRLNCLDHKRRRCPRCHH